MLIMSLLHVVDNDVNRPIQRYDSVRLDALEIKRNNPHRLPNKHNKDECTGHHRYHPCPVSHLGLVEAKPVVQAPKRAGARLDGFHHVMGLARLHSRLD